MLSDHQRKEIENLILACKAGLEDKKSYNRFHLQRIENLIKGYDTPLNQQENTQLNSSKWSEESRKEWIHSSFVELQGFINIKSIELREDHFKQAITDLTEAKKMLEIAKAQLKAKDWA